MSSEPAVLNRLEITRALKWADKDAIFVTVYLALTGGAFQTGFARHLGASDLWLGIIASVPAIAGSLQILAAYIGEHTQDRKSLVLRYVFLSRLPWLLIAFLPLFSKELPRLPLFVVLLTLSAVLGSFASPAFLAWLSDLVPADYRGRYFGRRNMILGLVSAITALPPALFLDQAVKHDRLPVPLAFTILFGTGMLFLALSQFALTRMPNVPRIMGLTGGQEDGVDGRKSFLQFYREPFSDRNFRRLLTFTTFWTFGHLFAGQFFTVYMLENLKFPYIMIQMTALVAALFSSLGMPFWGYLSDKFGNKPLLIISGSTVVFMPLIWTLTDPERYGWSVGVIMFIQVIAGFMWAGVGLSQFNMILNIAPQSQRTLYMGAISATGALIGGLAPLCSGLVMEYMRPIVPDPTRFYVLFCLTASLRGFALLWLKGLQEPSGTTAGYVLSQLRSSARPRGWWAIRRLKRSTDEAGRLQAVRTLAQARTPLAVEDLVHALHDPSPEIRREAAIALGEIKDPRAVPALLEVLNDPASNLKLEITETLGKIGHPSAVPDLILLLQSARLDVRLAAILALRQIADPGSLHALLERLSQTSSVAEQTRLLETIRDLLPILTPTLAHDMHVAETVLKCLDSPEEEVRADAAAALARLPKEDSFAPLLRLRLKQETGATALAALAQALGQHGSEEDISLLLNLLPQCDSLVGRQTIALAVAQLLGIEDHLYPLLTADDLTRDRLIERALQPFVRDKPALSDALRAYALGAYSTALHTLLDALPDHPRLQKIRHAPPRLETWLLAVACL
jgi:HEAT repeat protein